MVQIWKYEEFENKAYTTSFQMIFVVCSKCQFAATLLLKGKELKVQNTHKPF